jgi:hypothetical protein
MYMTMRTVPLLIGFFFFAAQAHSIQTPSSSMSGAEAQQLDPSRPVERELKAKQTHAYQVVLEAGQFLEATVDQRGIDVMVRVVAPDGSEIAEIDSPNGADGDEPIALEARATGTYRIEVSPLGMRAPWTGRYEIRVDRILTAEAYAERLAEKKRKRQPVIAWLKEHVIPLRTTEPGSGFDDLQPLKQVFRDVRFVGLGRLAPDLEPARLRGHQRQCRRLDPEDQRLERELARPRPEQLPPERGRRRRHHLRQRLRLGSGQRGRQFRGDLRGGEGRCARY